MTNAQVNLFLSKNSFSNDSKDVGFTEKFIKIIPPVLINDLSSFIRKELNNQQPACGVFNRSTSFAGKDVASGTMEQFEIKIERPKPSVLEEIIEVLKKILDYCLCCLTCGCYPGPGGDSANHINGESYGMILLDNEKVAVQNLLRYLEEEANGNPVLTDEHIRALCILTYSDNTELQRSAALCFTEISDRMKSPLSVKVARPLVELLKSRDVQVQKAATLAVSNFALSKQEANKEVIVKCGGMEPLLQLLHSKNVEVQCNTCGCVTTLATTEANKHLIVTGNGVRPLLSLMMSQDTRVQRNASGAILNLTHLQIQYYSAAALSNIAVNEKHRAMMVAIGHYDVIKQLIKLLSSKKDRVKCQACFALRNLASDPENQIIITKFGALPFLHQITSTCRKETLAAAVACLRNLSIHKTNETAIVNENFLIDLCRIVCDSSNPEGQRHAAGTIRNLAVGHHIRDLIEKDCVEALTFVLLDLESKLTVLAEEDNQKGVLLYIDMFLKSPEPNFIHIALWTLVQYLKDVIFLKAFKGHSIEPVITKLQSIDNPSTIIELANSVMRRLKDEESPSSSSDD
ncbi:hypothetical protein KUTeg_000727 [Tegillarca granosa]|uniref:Vacuolar protein 8 n=1 Tax=Tegillarca granosa TaxID=220873 RepID=A0ABQ9G1I4_TEGGR|nr:hypothetical protein KUTeg_000727 [Tegillarca granosa]